MVAGPQSPRVQVLFRLYMSGVPIWQPDIQGVCVCCIKFPLHIRSGTEEYSERVHLLSAGSVCSFPRAEGGDSSCEKKG